MERNVGGYDRIVRLVAGFALLVVGVLLFAGIGDLGTDTVMLSLKALIVIVGAILAVTGLTQVCIVNQALGIDTLEVSGG